MFKISNIISLMILLCISSCKKESPVKSRKLNVSVINKCSGSLKFYKDSAQVKSEIFDCNYEAIVRMQLESGNYKVVATSYGQEKIQDFIKYDYEQNLFIEF